MEPIRYENECPVFTTQQVDILGPPGEYGYEKYLVVDSAPEYVPSVNMWQQSTLISKHRYSRAGRFRIVVRNLFGESRIKIPDAIIILVKSYLKKDSPNLYEEVRRIIKHMKMPSLYRAIPSIVYRAHQRRLLLPAEKDSQDLSAVLEEVYVRFKVFESLFERVESERKYFPNLKYTALRILQGMGVLNSCIPPLLTKSKLESLDLFFAQMENLRNKSSIHGYLYKH
jgi:hypothetical protein